MFEELNDVVRDHFKTVKNASFSLEKVTVRDILYTVLITYFFHDGKLRAVVNSIHLMKSTEYDANATVILADNDLQRTSRMTRSQLACMTGSMPPKRSE